MGDAMADPSSTKLSDEMLSFNILQPATEAVSVRLGKLSIPGRKSIYTPHYVANTSRGAVSHISQDNIRSKTSISSAYFAIEDFIEKAPYQVPPIYKFPVQSGESRLRKFITLQPDVVTILGPRRIPAIPCPHHNTNTAISILTSVGFRWLEAEDYHEGSRTLGPDIFIGLADLPQDVYKSSKKRKEKMVDRTDDWIQTISSELADDSVAQKPALFAPILPLEPEQQSYYLANLRNLPYLSGLALFNSTSTTTIPVALRDLPRLSVASPSSPHALLHEISLGVDLSLLPFITTASDSGIALSFAFPAPDPSLLSKPIPLGIDMWSPAHATSMTPLTQGCDCYACTAHHSAYLHHLLSVKEMLGWVLLQIHNHAVMDRFFEGVRKSIAHGTFEEDIKTFGQVYEAEFPEKTGQGPRVRGYQFKSIGGGEPKKNVLAFRTLDDTKNKVADEGILSPNDDVKYLDEQGITEKIN
ncbi:MAG: hypothetical protein M1834_005093 [Cirrosporium novae-zelandiae]|nr:MAG: hypothetical protein M1834_005093 [Cirrosporium novae-zelandiae]